MTDGKPYTPEETLLVERIVDAQNTARRLKDELGKTRSHWSIKGALINCRARRQLGITGASRYARWRREELRIAAQAALEDRPWKWIYLRLGGRRTPSACISKLFEIRLKNAREVKALAEGE